MASINDIGVPPPGLGSGILYPKLRNRFRVLFFENDTDERVEALTPLTLQALAIDIGAEDLGSHTEPHHRTGRVVLTLEDDAACSVMTSVRIWQRRQAVGASFDLVMDTLNSNDEVTERFRFGACMLEALQHSTWRYDVPVSVTLQLQSPTTYVRDDRLVELDPVTQAIAAGVNLRMSGVNPEIPATCQKLLQIGFQTYQHTITQHEPQR